MRYPIIHLMAALALCAASSSLAADGAALFKQHCAGCHGPGGFSDTPAGKSLNVPALAGDTKIAGLTEGDIAAKIRANPKHAAALKSLKDDDVMALATYVQGLAASK